MTSIPPLAAMWSGVPPACVAHRRVRQANQTTMEFRRHAHCSPQQPQHQFYRPTTTPSHARRLPQLGGVVCRHPATVHSTPDDKHQNPDNSVTVKQMRPPSSHHPFPPRVASHTPRFLLRRWRELLEPTNVPFPPALPSTPHAMACFLPVLQAKRCADTEPNTSSHIDEEPHPTCTNENWKQPAPCWSPQYLHRDQPGSAQREPGPFERRHATRCLPPGTRAPTQHPHHATKTVHSERSNGTPSLSVAAYMIWEVHICMCRV